MRVSWVKMPKSGKRKEILKPKKPTENQSKDTTDMGKARPEWWESKPVAWGEALVLTAVGGVFRYIKPHWESPY